MRRLKDMTHIASTLLPLTCSLKERFPMQRSKTHFEQIPVKLVKQVAEEIYAQPETLEDFDLADAPHFTDGRPSQHSRRLPAQPHFLPGCALCGREVLLETSKFDEAGKAIHEECAV